MQQKGQGDDARLIFVTHVALESAVAATIRAVRDLDAVKRVGSVLRVVGGEE
jgi:homoserine dehydrogenase